MNTENNRETPQRPLRTITLDEQRRLEEALQNKHTSVRLAAQLMGRLGLRVGEVTSLQWENVWLNLNGSGEIEITAAHTKTGYARILPLTKTLRITLQELKEEAWDRVKKANVGNTIYEISGALSAQYVIGKKNGKALTRRWFQLTINRTAKEVLGRQITPHTLRHSFATRLLQNTNIRVVQDALGHRSIRSTQIYTHPTLQDLKEAIERCDQEVTAEREKQS